jgi:lipoprotein-releasing system ATP-binding protein
MQVTLPEKPGESKDAAGSAAAAKLHVTSLRKAFRSPAGTLIKVLRDVSFSASGGETVAVMGASGAGKSTLLHLLGGLESPDGGLIERPSGHRGAAAAEGKGENQVSFVFQFHYLLPDLTAVENVALPLMIGRLGRNESLRRATSALEEIGLGERLAHRTNFLSGGEQQRVAVARALITTPRLVLADEPTGNLDASIADEVGALVIDYCRRQLAIAVIATHNERLAQLCSRVLILEDGRVHDYDLASRAVDTQVEPSRACDS